MHNFKLLNSIIISKDSLNRGFVGHETLVELVIQGVFFEGVVKFPRLKPTFFKVQKWPLF